MIMIRPSPTQKVGKPPPPVPPRPSKTAVAEALAKSRFIKGGLPTRQAPPPPAAPLDVARSKSSYSVNVMLKKPPIAERPPVSEEAKNGPRPVVYQSTKCNSNNSKVQITRKDDGDVKIVSRADSFRNKDAVQVIRRDSLKKPEDAGNRTQLSRRESEKRDGFSLEKSSEGGRGGNDHFKCDISDANSNSDQSKSCDSSDKNTEAGYDSGSTNSLEKKNWDKMLNDRNHVNTLIDEMFASVLEVQFNDEEIPQTQFQSNQTNGVSQDKTKLIIDNTSEATYENVRIENGIVSFDSTKTEDSVPKTIIVIKNETCEVEEQKDRKEDRSYSTDNSNNNSNCNSNNNSVERSKQVKFKDQFNHELLINELQCMKKDQEKILKRQRKPSMNIYDDSVVVPKSSENVLKIEPPDWSDVGSGDGETKLSTCQITINDVGCNEEKKATTVDYERITKMSSLHGLPPLPKSLSGFNLLEAHQGAVVNPPTPMRSSSMRAAGQQVPPGHLVYPPHPKVNGGGGDMTLPQLGTPGRKSTNLDTQLAILRREMYSLRQLDLSLLSQLWSLNESIQDFRQILQDQEDRVLSPPSPSPTPSSGEDVDGDEFYMSASSLNFRPAPPPPPVARRPSSSSNASSLG